MMPNTTAYSFGDVVLVPFPFSGLLKASLLKPVLATIEQGLIFRKLGALQGSDVPAVRSALRQILG